MPSPRPRRLGLLLAGAAALVTACAGASAQSEEPREVAYVLVPHPDDEFQAWSLVEDSPHRYTVFVLLTEGEQTGFCEPEGYAVGHQPDVEPAAQPVPVGKWSPECSEARLHSWRGFFEDMSAADPSVPGRFEELGRKGPFPADAALLCRQDDPGTTCTSDTGAQVWRDTEGRGALVVFNLGDGDLTEDEVTWALSTVRSHREELGLDTDLPEAAVIGASYAHDEDHAEGCFPYPHPDHEAVGAVVAGTDLGVPEQLTAVCAAEPDVVHEAAVSDESVAAAFGVGPDGERLGAHVRHYGWLWSGHYPIDVEGQRELFHSHQSFRGRSS